MCTKCGEAAETEEHIKLGEAKYHKRCFRCFVCDTQLGVDAEGRVFVYDGHPHCEQHYHEKNGTICVVCNKGVRGRLHTSPVTQCILF